MEFSKAYLVYFSPTSTSKRVATAIVHGTGLESVSEINLTYDTSENLFIPSDALTIIAVPVYGGKVAPLAMERLKKVKSEGSPTVLAVVYGNRAYERALMELDMYAVRNGFNVIAGATFIGEHSYSTAENPISAGRPNTDDLAFASDFGKQIIAKIEEAEDIDSLRLIDVRSIRKPKQPFIPLFQFMRQMIKLRKSGVPLPKTPLTDADACIHCGICVKACPSSAIKLGNEQETNAEKCIKCCACVKKCPQNARDMNTPMAPLLSTYFRRQKAPQTLV